MKRYLESLILRTRGDHRLLLGTIEKMSEAEAEQWYRLLQNTAEDAKRDGERSGARQPWKHGGYG